MMESRVQVREKIYVRLNCDAGEMKEHKFAFYWLMYIQLFWRKIRGGAEEA